MPLEDFFRDNLRSDIVRAVFHDEYFRTYRAMETIIAENYRLGGSPYSFLIAGRRYSLTPSGAKEKGTKPIHPSLGSKAREVIRNFEIYNAHANKLEGFCLMMQESCSTYQDVRDFLPNVVVDALDEDHILKLYSRQRPARAMVPDPAKWMRYESMLKVFFQYLSRKLIL